jgi:rhodanese-related sulfurtransferase
MESIQLSPAQLAERLNSSNSPRLLDVREPDEHYYAALPNSKLVPLGELMERLDELESWKDQEIVVYCHHGIRSMRAIAQLRHAGFSRLWNLSGGIDRWSVEVDPALRRY